MTRDRAKVTVDYVSRMRAFDWYPLEGSQKLKTFANALDCHKYTKHQFIVYTLVNGNI